EKLAENQGDIGWLRLRGRHGRLRCQFLPGRIKIGAEPKQMGGGPSLAAHAGADDTELERGVGATDGLSLAACAEPVISVRCLGHGLEETVELLRRAVRERVSTRRT